MEITEIHRYHRQVVAKGRHRVPVNFVPFVGTPRPASTTEFVLARVAKDFSSAPYKKVPNTFAWLKKLVPLTSDVVIVVNFADFKSASWSEWSRR